MLRYSGRRRPAAPTAKQPHPDKLPRTMPLPVSTSALRLHCFRALQPGPRLIVTGAVHGNETCGSQAIERVAREFDSGTLVLQHGSLTLVPVTNPLAFERGQRNGDRNLNRNLLPTAQPQDFEDRVANVLCPLLAEHDVLLDLHSFHSAGEPFLMLGPQNNDGPLEPFALAADEQALALRLGPRRIVDGWLNTYADGVRRRLARTQPSAMRANSNRRLGCCCAKAAPSPLPMHCMPGCWRSATYWPRPTSPPRRSTTA